jgi:hypothetical protein
MPAATSDDIRALGLELAGSPDRDDRVARLVEAAGGDRFVLESARNDVAKALHGKAGDFTATSALALLNKALVSVGWTDPYDWKIRWSQRFRRP